MIIYTDGACSANGTAQAKGGFGVLVVDSADGDLINCHQEFSENTTNNREELKAILWAMMKYGTKDISTAPIVFSDSAYCVNTFNIWMWSWEQRGWAKSNNQTPLNLDLIQMYHRLWQQGYRIDLRKVKGHAGVRENELADKLATGELSVNEVKKLYG